MVRITAGDEEELEQAVAVAGPVSVAVDSRHTSFQVSVGVAFWYLVHFTRGIKDCHMAFFL